MTQAAKRLLGRPVSKKKPVRSTLLDDIYLKNSDQIRSDPVVRRDCILPNLTNKGFLRISELLRVQRRHIILNEDNIDIFIPERKNDPFCEGHTVNIFKSNSISCAYTAIINLLKDIPENPDSFLIFKCNKKQITSAGISTSWARVLF